MIKRFGIGQSKKHSGVGIFLILILMGLILKANEIKDPLFDGKEVLNLEISYDMNKFKKDWRKNRRYHPAKFTFTNQQGSLISMDVKIRIRGNLRRTDKEFKCQVPNFKIKFKKSQRKNTIFKSNSPIKLVLHCKNKLKKFQNYVFYEYYCYKIYQLLTGLSFRVRLARITYIDTLKKTKPFTKYGFFIENYKQMAKRNKARTVKLKKIRLEDADFYTQTLMGIFQFLIGNTDWSIRSGHNIRLVKFKKSNKYFTIPFDFDQSGIVEAPYAAPNENLPIRTVRERLFRGWCKDEEQFARFFPIFNQHREEIISLYRDSPFISDKRKKRNIKYIEEFYKIINKPNLIKRYFINNFRGSRPPRK